MRVIIQCCINSLFYKNFNKFIVFVGHPYKKKLHRQSHIYLNNQVIECGLSEEYKKKKKREKIPSEIQICLSH